jgi:hypothetical protein
VQVIRWVADQSGDTPSGESHALVREIVKPAGEGDNVAAPAAPLDATDNLVIPPFPVMVNGMTVRLDDQARRAGSQ